MQELEKILEEIERVENEYINEDHNALFKLGAAGIASEIKDIIREHMNDGWIPVKRGLPEDDVNVLITYADIDDDQYVGIDITNYGYAYLGGNKLDFKEWRSPFEYFGSNYKVVAWRPLPEPYRPERSEK